MSIWFSPEWNEIRVHEKRLGFLFKDEHGIFHAIYDSYPINERSFKVVNFYYSGEL